MRNISRTSIFFLLAGFVGLFLDQWSKNWVVNNIQSMDDFFSLLPVLKIVRSHNYGVSFGMLGDLRLSPWMYAGVVTAALAMLGHMFVNLKNVWLRCGVVCISIGAIGNQMDRFIYGHVVDFISVHWFEKYHFYVFNVADILITCGAILVALVLFLDKDS
jgi:signal peptidase II